MDDRALQLASSFVTPRYIDAGTEALHSHSRTLRSLLAQRRCPEDGLSDELIEMLLLQLALMDTNNFPTHVGGGEREGRVMSTLVRRRVYGMTHGVGRSGDLNADQPKAAGSSLLAQLTNAMMLDLVRLAGAVSTKAAAVVPMATGMTLALVMRCIANRRETEVCQAVNSSLADDARMTNAESAPPRYVIWPRIDQKTSLKCIEAAGLRPVVVPLRKVRARSDGDDVSHASTEQGKAELSFPTFLQVHVDDVRASINAVGGPQQVVCVLSTTSCFAPRLPDNVVAIAQLCKELQLPYVINNAYGVQSRSIMGKIDAAMRLGRVDYVVQSGDKNFLVPVGGSVVCACEKEKLKQVMAIYAGRASAAPVTDLFITALSLGRSGMQRLWSERYERRKELEAALLNFASARGERLLQEELRKDREEGRAEQAGESIDGGTSEERGGRKKKATAFPVNDISFCVTMQHLYKSRTSAPVLTAVTGNSASAEANGNESEAESELLRQREARECCEAARAFGAKLFRSGVTGPRVIVPSLGQVTNIIGCPFVDYGMHCQQEDDHSGGSGGRQLLPFPLLVLACGIGMSAGEVTGLMARLEELWPPASPLSPPAAAPKE